MFFLALSHNWKKGETKHLEFDLTLLCRCKASEILINREIIGLQLDFSEAHAAHHHLAPASHIRLLFQCCNALICSCDPFKDPPIFAFLWIYWPKERVARPLNIVNYCFFFVFMSSQLNLSIKQFEPSKRTGWLLQVLCPSWNLWQLREMQTREKQLTFKMISKESLVGINNALELTNECFAINTQQDYNLQRFNRFAKGVVQHSVNKFNCSCTFKSNSMVVT